MTNAYAGIGSRSTPERIKSLMTRAASRLEEMGFVLRSGAAEGADAAFERGVISCAGKEIYLPWARFRGHASTLHSLPNLKQSLVIASQLHPAWGQCSRAVRLLMARNTYQVLGSDLDSPAAFVLCWTPDGAQNPGERTRETGGTGQALELAWRHEVPVFNLARPGCMDRLKEHLDDQSQKHELRERPCKT